MKAFIAALVLLALLIGAAFWSTEILAGAAEEMTGMARTLPEKKNDMRTEEARKLRETWEFWHFPFTLTTNHNEFDLLEPALARLEAAAEAKSGDEFLIAAQEITSIFEEIEELYAVNWDTIL